MTLKKNIFSTDNSNEKKKNWLKPNGPTESFTAAQMVVSCDFWMSRILFTHSSVYKIVCNKKHNGDHTIYKGHSSGF